MAALSEHVRQNTRLFVVGQDNPHTFLKLARNLDVSKQVEFLGGRDDIPDLLFAADLLLHPAYRENTGTVLLESVAAKLPVLCSGECGYAFHIQAGQCGYVLSSPFDQQEMNTQLVKLLDSSAAEPLQHNAAKYIEENDLFSMPQKAVDYIQQSIGR